MDNKHNASKLNLESLELESEESNKNQGSIASFKDLSAHIAPLDV